MPVASKRQKRERRQRRAASLGLKALAALKTQFRLADAKDQQYAQDKANIMAALYILLDGQGYTYKVSDEDHARIVAAMEGTNLRISHDEEKKEWSIEVVRTVDPVKEQIEKAAAQFKSDLKVRKIEEESVEQVVEQSTWETVPTEVPDEQ